MDTRARHQIAKVLRAAADAIDGGTPVTGSVKALYHLTDKAKFSLDPKRVPTDNTFALQERTAPGLYLVDKYGVERWLNGNGYWRPFVVEVMVPEEYVRPERWSGELFLPAEHFDKAKIERVLPLDAFAREVFKDYGWTETHFETTFDTNEPIEMRVRHTLPMSKPPPGWHFRGDVRTMSPAWVKQYKKRVRDYARATR